MSSATIQSLFPYTQNRAEDFTVVPCYCEFSAPIVGGKYVFDFINTPPVEFEKLLQGQKGIIAGVMISANCSDAEFTAAVKTPLMLQVLHGENNTPINIAAFPITQFAWGGQFQLQWEITGSTMLQEEPVKLAITGEVEQIPGMLSNELTIRVGFNYYRVGKKNLKG